MSEYAYERHIAELAVLRASILTKQVQSGVSEIPKEDNSPVTIADFAAQALIIKALHHVFPNDMFLGEENSAALRSDEKLRDKVYDLILAAEDVINLRDSGKPLPKPESVEEMLDLIDLGGHKTRCKAGRFWTIDPVDGTAAFLKGQQYAVSLALIEDGREVVGIIGCPNISAEMTRVTENEIDKTGLGIMLTAVRGQGSAIRTMTPTGLGDSSPLETLRPLSSKQLHIVDCATAVTCRHDVIAKLADKFETTFPNTEIWSSHIRYAALIVGGGDVHFLIPAGPATKMPIWDHAGSQLIFTELGGKVTDLDGNEIDFCAGRDLNRNRGLIVARGGIHGRILATMKTILVEESR